MNGEEKPDIPRNAGYPRYLLALGPVTEYKISDMSNHAGIRLRLRVMGHVPRGPVNEMLPFFYGFVKRGKREIGETPLVPVVNCFVQYAKKCTSSYHRTKAVPKRWKYDVPKYHYLLGHSSK